MQQPAGIGPQPRRRQPGQIRDVAVGARDAGKPGVAGAGRRCLADRQHRYGTFAIYPGEGPHTVGAGKQQGLNTVKIEPGIVAVDDVEQRLL